MNKAAAVVALGTLALVGAACSSNSSSSTTTTKAPATTTTQAVLAEDSSKTKGKASTKELQVALEALRAPQDPGPMAAPAAKKTGPVLPVPQELQEPPVGFPQAGLVGPVQGQAAVRTGGDIITLLQDHSLVFPAIGHTSSVRQAA